MAHPKRPDSIRARRPGPGSAQACVQGGGRGQAGPGSMRGLRFVLGRTKSRARRTIDPCPEPEARRRLETYRRAGTFVSGHSPARQLAVWRSPMGRPGCRPTGQRASACLRPHPENALPTGSARARTRLRPPLSGAAGSRKDRPGSPRPTGSMPRAQDEEPENDESDPAARNTHEACPIALPHRPGDRSGNRGGGGCSNGATHTNSAFPGAGGREAWERDGWRRHRRRAARHTELEGAAGTAGIRLASRCRTGAAACACHAQQAPPPATSRAPNGAGRGSGALSGHPVQALAAAVRIACAGAGRWRRRCAWRRLVTHGLWLINPPYDLVAPRRSRPWQSAAPCGTAAVWQRGGGHGDRPISMRPGGGPAVVHGNCCAVAPLSRSPLTIRQPAGDAEWPR